MNTRLPNFAQKNQENEGDRIVIIAILAGMLLPALGQVKAKGKEAACSNNLSQIGKACAIFANDPGNAAFPYAAKNYGGTAPADTSDNDTNVHAMNFGVLYQQNILKEPKSFVCPETTVSAQTTIDYTAETPVKMKGANISYVYFTGDGVGINPQKANYILAADGVDKNGIWSHGTNNTQYITASLGVEHVKLPASASNSTPTLGDTTSTSTCMPTMCDDDTSTGHTQAKLTVDNYKYNTGSAAE